MIMLARLTANEKKQKWEGEKIWKSTKEERHINRRYIRTKKARQTEAAYAPKHTAVEKHPRERTLTINLPFLRDKDLP